MLFCVLQIKNKIYNMIQFTYYNFDIVSINIQTLLLLHMVHLLCNQIDSWSFVPDSSIWKYLQKCVICIHIRATDIKSTCFNSFFCALFLFFFFFFFFFFFCGVVLLLQKCVRNCIISYFPRASSSQSFKYW